MAAAMYPRLVGDVGGTNARFAWIDVAGAAPVDVAVLRVADHASLHDALSGYLAAHPRPGPQWAALGIATTVAGDHVRMTNHPWQFSIAALQRTLGFERLLVVNDFAALALALPVLPPDALRPVGGGRAAAGAPIGLLGAGTGLGVPGLVTLPCGPGVVPLGGEGGHVTLAAADDFEARVVARLRERYGHASAERALSGPGLENLHEALARLDGVPAALLPAAEITARALAGGDALCVRTVELFFALLGGVAGNLALTLGARGGVYIGGGIVPKLGDWIERSAFRERFEAKGRFAGYLAQVPTWVVTAEVWPALVGAGRALDVY